MNSEPEQQAKSGGSTLSKAIVKFFNITRGFGIVVLCRTGQSAFMHIKTLQNGGFDLPKPGDTIECEVVSRHRGLEVEAIHSLSSSQAEPLHPIESEAPVGEPGPRITGVIKFFKVEPGYGFVAVEGQVDIFLHLSVLARASILSVSPGQTIVADTIITDRGQQISEVISVS